MLSMKDKWFKFLMGTPPFHVISTCPMIRDLLNKIEPMGKTFIDWGSGTGFTAIALANKKRQVVGYDINEKLVEFAKDNYSKYLVSLEGAVSFTYDIDDLVPADIIYSQGLLEHFNDNEICELIATQMIYAKKAVVFSVPSVNYKRIDFGDERLMDLKQWEEILKPYEKQLRELYYYDERRQIMGVIKCQKKAKENSTP